MREGEIAHPRGVKALRVKTDFEQGFLNFGVAGYETFQIVNFFGIIDVLKIRQLFAKLFFTRFIYPLRDNIYRNIG